MLKIKILPITFEIVTNECAENKVLPITFEIITDEYVLKINLVIYVGEHFYYGEAFVPDMLMYNKFLEMIL